MIVSGNTEWVLIRSRDLARQDCGFNQPNSERKVIWSGTEVMGRGGPHLLDEGYANTGPRTARYIGCTSRGNRLLPADGAKEVPSALKSQSVYDGTTFQLTSRQTHKSWNFLHQGMGANRK